MQGVLSYSGFINSGGGSAPPSGGGYAQVTGVAGAGGNNPTVGSNTWTVAALVGATELNFTIVNGLPETAIGDTPDFSFNSGTGTITRNNKWQLNDWIIVPNSPAS